MYRHGVYVEEKATGLITTTEVDSALPVIIGTAPVHTLQGEKSINKLELIFEMKDFYTAFGIPEDGKENDYTLVQFAKIYLERYKLAPIVCINVFDPEKHKGENDLPDVTQVLPADIIGGVDAGTQKRRGISLVHQVFPKFRLIPGTIIAPKFSQDSAVALALAALAEKVSTSFKAMGIADIPHNLESFNLAPEYVNDNNLISPYLIHHLGDYVYNNVQEAGSMHLAAVIALRDSQNDNIPYHSPSNTNVLANGAIYKDETLELILEEANYLNGNGIVTTQNMIGGMVIWGNKTSAYPSITDVRENSIPIRRMFNWIGNNLVLASWQKVDAPVTRRFVETVQDSFNVWLNGLTAREFILGGRVSFEIVDNPTDDLMNGIVRWHLYVTPPNAAKEIVWILEYDPNNLNTLFSI